MGRQAVRGAVHDTGGHRGLLDELGDARGVGGDLVAEGGEGAVPFRAEPQPVQGRGAVPGDGGQVAAGQRELDGPAGVDRRHRGEHDVRARCALAAEAASDVLGDDGDPVLGQVEEGGEDGADGVAALAGVVHGEPAAGVVGGGGVRLHGVVVQGRHPVGGVDAYGGGGEGGGRVAALAVAGLTAVGLLGGVRLRVVLGEDDVVRLRLVAGVGVRDADGGGDGAGRLRRLGQGEGDVPAAVRDGVVLQDVEFGVVGRRGEARRVERGEDGDRARQGQGGRGVDGGDPAAGDPGGDGPGVETAGRGVLGCVPRGAGDLVAAFDALGGGAEGVRGGGHGGPSPVRGGGHRRGRRRRPRRAAGRG